tara:strand:+ start:363 stop:596 length:234 start_codon:yes stop_codon:yes gene_type:complete
MTQASIPFDDYNPPFKGRGSVTKQELCEAYNFSLQTLGRLLNKQYYSILSELGYNKRSNILSPKIINKFIELYGEPL